MSTEVNFEMMLFCAMGGGDSSQPQKPIKCPSEFGDKMVIIEVQGILLPFPCISCLLRINLMSNSEMECQQNILCFKKKSKRNHIETIDLTALSQKKNNLHTKNWGSKNWFGGQPEGCEMEAVKKKMAG